MPKKVKGGLPAKHSNRPTPEHEYRVLSPREILRTHLTDPDFFRVEIHGQSQTAHHRFVETFETCQPLLAVGAAVIEFFERAIVVRIDHIFVSRRKQPKKPSLL